MKRRRLRRAEVVRVLEGLTAPTWPRELEAALLATRRAQETTGRSFDGARRWIWRRMERARADHALRRILSHVLGPFAES